MANFKAFDSFISLSFNLNAIHSLSTGFYFYNNASKVIDGKAYQDVAGFFFEDFTQVFSTFYIGGTGLKFDSQHFVTAGKLTGFSAFVGKVGDLTNPHYTLSGVHLSAVALDAAARSADPLDDIKVLSDALSGNDKITMSSSYDIMSGYAGDDVIYGKAGDDTLYGGDGNDKLLGGIGADELQGDAGNDILNGGAGNDTASYLDSTAGVTVDLSLTTKQNTVGAGIDTLISIERLYGGHGNDTLTGSKGNNEIIGQEGNDTINGGAGDDLINGDLGNDILTGGLGRDSFRFAGPLTADNADTITDFSHAERDKIVLSHSYYPGLSGPTGHAILADEFYAAAGATTAHDATDRIIYNTATGVLYYDPDGSGGEAALQIATLGSGTHPALVANDFLLAPY